MGRVVSVSLNHVVTVFYILHTQKGPGVSERKQYILCVVRRGRNRNTRILEYSDLSGDGETTFRLYTSCIEARL